MTDFIGLCLKIVETMRGATLDGDIDLIFVKLGNVMNGFTPVLTARDRDDHMSRTRGSTRNRCSKALERWSPELVN